MATLTIRNVSVEMYMKAERMVTTVLEGKEVVIFNMCLLEITRMYG